MKQIILALVAGIVLGNMTVGLVELLSFTAFPPPAGADLTDPAAMAAYGASLPAAAFGLVMLAWFAGATVGVGAARAISPVAWPAGSIGLMQLAAVVSNFFAFTHPAWVMVVGPLMSLGGSALGFALGTRWAQRRAQA